MGVVMIIILICLVSVFNGIVSGVVMETLACISCNGRYQVWHLFIYLFILFMYLFYVRYSLHLHGGLVHFKTSEPSEMLRRRLVLLLYLLRSPFYEKHTK